MAAKGEWNIPNYELEKLANFLLPKILKDFVERQKEQNNLKNNPQ